MSGKGKEKVTDKGKRKWTGDDDKTGGKRKNRSVIQFFDEDAQVDEDELSSDDYMSDEQDYAEDGFASELKSKEEPRKVPDLPFVPKEEEMSEEELERIMEERYKPGAGYVTYAEDGYENKRSVGGDTYAPSAKDPAIWKVKCTVGRERYSAFCLMQKYVEMELLKTKLPIISAFSPDYVKGFIFIEADKQNDVYEACKGINTIYPSKVIPIPGKDFSRLLSVRSKCSGISKNTWARVKNGTYKGDLAWVVAVNDERKKVTVKLIPRIDLKAMAQKFGGGVASKRIIPPQRLISPSELDEFRPLIQSRRDRDTNEMFEVLDGIMLKDGYVYKKVSIDSLSFWGVVPTEDELLKFEPAKKDDTTDVQWLSQLFGEKKKRQIENFKPDKGSGKSEGSTSSSMGNNFEVHDLVFFGRKDFGVVIGSEKDDSVKIIKEGSDGPSIVTVKQSDLKRASFDKKLFSVSDQHSNTISINDIVRILDGPLKEREGVVKKIYKGILFLCDESVQENNGYFSVKALLCEKVNLSGKESHEKGSEPGPSGFPDMLSPKSPLSPEKSYPERDNESSFQREEDGMFSVGQSLRIRVGPLKGYRCRVLAIRRSDVTVKLDSQQKILTVKSEHLSEVRGRNSAVSQGDESGSMKPFGFLATEDGASDWTSEATLPNDASNWNAGGSTQRNSWSAFDSSNSLLSKQPDSVDPIDATEGTGWHTKASEESSSWGAAIKAKQDSVPEAGDGGKVAEANGASSGDAIKDNSWGAAADKWGSGGVASGKAETSWGKQMETQPEDKAENASKGWDTKMATEGAVGGSQWNTENDKPAWGISSGGNQDSGSSWNKPAEKSWGQSAVEKASQKSDGWGSAKSDMDNSASGWNVSKGSENIKSSGWGGASSGNGESGNGWSTDGKKGGSGSWKDGGSSTGWGKTSWGETGGSEANGNQESAWGNKGSWTAGGGDRGGRSDRGGGFQGGRGGSTCYKCGEEGHMSRECPQGGGGGGRGGSGCFKCGEEGHMSRECPQGGGGGGRGGSGCFKCGEEGHMSRECPQGGGGGGRGGSGCYKCGEEGHMARDCTQGGGRGGSACFKCGEEGHMSRECPKGGGGGGRGGSACFKCGEEGHMSRECPQGGGGGGRGGGSGCFKCGEEGHMARECPQGGGGGRGGSGCFKCGEEGHMARDCSQSGGGGGRYGSAAGGRSGGGGGSCYKCGEEGHFARECPTAN